MDKDYLSKTEGIIMLYIKYLYHTSPSTYHQGSILIKNMPAVATIYDYKNLICDQLRSDLNRGFDVYQIDILSMDQVA